MEPVKRECLLCLQRDFDCFLLDLAAIPIVGLLISETAVSLLPPKNTLLTPTFLFFLSIYL